MTFREIVILQLLERGERYGAQIQKDHNEVMHLPLNEGSLYNTLNRMETKGWISGKMARGQSTSRKRRFFNLTRDGKKNLAHVRHVLGVTKK